MGEGFPTPSKLLSEILEELNIFFKETRKKVVREEEKK